MGPGHSDRAGVVLAAGLGSRLTGVSQQTTLKPLTPVGGVSLFERTIRGLELAGCTKVVVVLGFQAEAVRRAIEANLPAAVSG